ncbi:hypothetical protein GCM10023193_30860 [Planotetraspora kaengkrachanensis]|uniref:Uncharacterized protein n=1 Tax=Planotetraspora kaengkrachanensis TaxID=575193 RepID=A0A8J3LXL9_9ACTN|nr:hypothetical protein Pka01_17170 [Planotetraspora kaengkrachanensis]
MRHERDVQVCAFLNEVVEGLEQWLGVGAVRVEKVLGVRQHGQGETGAFLVEVPVATGTVSIVRARRRGAYQRRQSADGGSGQSGLNQGTASDTVLFAYVVHQSPNRYFLDNGRTVFSTRGCPVKQI